MKALAVLLFSLFTLACETGVDKHGPMDQEDHSSTPQRPAPGDSTGESLRTSPAAADTDSVR